MPKKRIIETKEQAIQKLKETLCQKEFCRQHRTLEKAIRIILERGG